MGRDGYNPSGAQAWCAARGGSSCDHSPYSSDLGVMAAARTSAEFSLFGSLKQGGYRADTGLWIGIHRTDLNSVNSFRWYDKSPISNPQQYFCSGEPGNREYGGAFWSQTYCLEGFSYNWYVVFHLLHHYSFHRNGATGWWDVFHVVCSLNTCQDAEYSTDGGVTCLTRSTCSASQYQQAPPSTSSLFCYDTTGPGSACYYTYV